MKKFLYSLFIAFLAFVILNFFYSNLGGPAFGYPLQFRFEIPPFLALVSRPVPSGFVVICAFCVGILFLPLLQLIPWIFRSRQVRSRDKRIRELEEELKGQEISSVTGEPVIHEESSASSSSIP